MSDGIVPKPSGASAAGSPPLPADPIGRTIGHYHILERIGEGGMGVVYRGSDTRLGRFVAVKILPADKVADRERKRRFVLEAKAASALNHPSIITIYDIDHSEGMDFIVMEFVKGRTLADVIPHDGLPITQALGYAIQMASALAKAHSAGIVHRDLKPRNVMVTDDGTIKILDFGLAKLLPGSSTAAPYALPSVTTQATTLTTGASAGDHTQGGAILGTFAYMAPEQAEGKPVDSRADVFSLGVVLYEMLSGRQPFRKESALATLASILRDPPPAIESIRPGMPRALQRVLERALQKQPHDRYASGAELMHDLEAIQRNAADPASLQPAPGRWNRRPVLAGAAVLLLFLAVFGFLSWQRWSRTHWARTDGLREVSRLAAADQPVAAFDLAGQIRDIIPTDPQLLQIWPEVAHTPLIESDPPGAEVFFRELRGSTKPWRLVGKTPLQGVPVPHGYFEWKAVKPGHADALGSACTWWSRFEFRLPSAGEVPDGMVLVPGADTMGAFIGNVGALEAPREAFFIDKFEVTNKEFRQFVLQGGYEKREFWTVPFQKDGQSLSWEEAMREFRDTTGRPGPSTWEGGAYPQGQDHYPVSGVSWYEAAAYAAFAGKSLPTLSHWFRAADVRLTPFLIHVSNFNGKGAVPVGTLPGIGPFGTFDMAGNVQEWCWNETDGQFRFILGGAWTTPTYQFNQADAKPPFDRRPSNGFRCVRYPQPVPESLTAAKVRTLPDYSNDKPVEDDVFQIIRTTYAYDPKELNAQVHEVDDSSPYWRKERITFDAAYGTERVLAFLFLPRNAKPPYQTLVYHPGAGALSGKFANLDGFNRVDFVIRSGRAVIYPILLGMYDRQLPPTESVNERRDRNVKRFQDLERAVEYLHTRLDVNTNRIGFIGVSWGAWAGAVPLALDHRFKTAVLSEGGLPRRAPLAELDTLNFLPRVRAPVLMLNGKYDYTFPLESSQKPFFQWLGTPPNHKRHIVYDSAHDVMIHRTEVVREVLAWLDTYLGPVSR